ncbi:MAG TPA: replication-relaxation family protein [Actinomycetota bacterium]|nr:replication-relaxation family protein [Actinomycetota bacterium]
MARAEQNDLRAREGSLDERDHEILISLLDHKVLTTDQIKSLFFRSLRRCQHRLRELRELRVVASFEPKRGFGQGRPPDCLYLTRLGLDAIAERRGVRASDLSWIPGESYRTSRNLAHRLGVNAFFCGLVEASRVNEGHCLVTWRPEHWVQTKTSEVKPDGFGRYLHPGGACEFYLEYDRGTEAFGALSRKLEGYLRLAVGWTEDQGLTGFPNLLIIVPEEVRKGGVGSALRHAIGRLHIGGSLATSFPFYLAAEDVLTELGVLAPAWIHLATESDGLSLLDLPVRPGELYRTVRCLGRYFTDADSAGRWRRISPDSAPPRFPALPPRLPP